MSAEDCWQDVWSVREAIGEVRRRYAEFMTPTQQADLNRAELSLAKITTDLAQHESIQSPASPPPDSGDPSWISKGTAQDRLDDAHHAAMDSTP